MLQYIELSLESHLIVVPKKPNIPVPNSPPEDFDKEPFPILYINNNFFYKKFFYNNFFIFK
jgi:hypothetical protein